MIPQRETAILPLQFAANRARTPGHPRAVGRSHQQGNWAALNLAEGTVKVHLHRIYRKLGIANRTALAILAHQNFDAA